MSNLPGTDFPTDGERNWGPKFRASWNTLKGYLSDVVALVTTGRLSETGVTNTVNGVVGSSEAVRLKVVRHPDYEGFGILVPVGSTNPGGGQDVAPVILTTTLGALTAGVPVSLQIAATGEPEAFFVSAGSLPTGLQLSRSGLITGTPSAAGSYSFTITATNAVEADTQDYAGTIVSADSPPVITGPSSIMLTQGVPASAQFTASGKGPITFAVTGGNPPAGLNLTSAGVLSGTPTGSGAYSVEITATGPTGTDKKLYTGTVVASSAPVNPTPGGSAGRVASYGANGSHYPSRTPRTSDTSGWAGDLEVECTWPAIGQAITTLQSQFPDGKCRIRVKPGTLPGNGAGSTSTPVLQNLGGKNRASRILIMPRDGLFSVKHSASARIHNVSGVSFVGFTPWGEGLPESASWGILATNCSDFAWAWSKTRFTNITSTAGSTDGVEFVECVAPLQGSRDEDRMAIRNGDGGNTYNVLYDGCYYAGNHKAAGSSAHCDTLQLSGNGVFQGISFRDTAIFGSTNATYITTGAATGHLIHSALVGGFRTALRYIVGSDRSQFVNGPVAFNGDAMDYKASEQTLLVGKVVPKFTSVSDSKVSVPAPDPASGAWTVDSGLLDSVAKMDATIPMPTDADMRAWWKLAA